MEFLWLLWLLILQLLLENSIKSTKPIFVIKASWLYKMITVLRFIYLKIFKSQTIIKIDFSYSEIAFESRFFKSHYRASHMCWLHSYSLYIGFLAIIAVILCYNTFVCICVMRETTTKRKKVKLLTLNRKVLNNFCNY